MDLSISVVIPAYNEADNIERCLHSLADQRTAKKFEVVLVDNNSTDATVTKAKRYENKLDLKIVTEKNKGRGAARKTGFDHARGEIILSTDADVVLPPDWIETLYDKLVKSKGVAVTGTCRIDDCGRTVNMVFNRFQPVIMKGYGKVFGHYWLSGFSFAIYKKAYLESGGFNGKLNIQEDIDLSMKVSRVGEIIFLDKQPILFSGRRFKGGLVRGTVPYITTFLKYYFLKKENVAISDPR